MPSKTDATLFLLRTSERRPEQVSARDQPEAVSVSVPMR